MNANMLDELARRLAGALPPGAGELKRDLDKNLHAALRSGLSKLDLVTREEFDVQCGVLARTRAKVDTLEKQVRDLEAKLKAREE